MSVTEIAGRVKKSRWGVYCALKEAGVDTTQHNMRKRLPTDANLFLDNQWSELEYGRSPKNIEELEGIKQSTMIACLRNRRDSLASKAESVALPEFKGDVFFKVDPYLMTVEFTGKLNKVNGQDYKLVLTESKLIERLAND